MSTLSTHVLDAALGVPAAGLAVTVRDGDADLLTATTDDDGRIRFDAELEPGAYALVFATGAWFAAADRDTFFPEVAVTFTASLAGHAHVALLLSPYSYTTYRGS